MFTHSKIRFDLLKRVSRAMAFGPLLISMMLFLSTACGSRNMSFELLSESATFNQSSAEVSGKIDIIWVIDNSGSMDTSQQAIAANFQRFIQQFEENGFDFHMVVTSSEAYKDDFNSNLTLSRYHAGTYDNGQGQMIQAPQVLTKNTPNLERAFIANILRGVSGSGDERTLQSMRSALNNTSNRALGFPRADAFLSVIMLSDEDDFSWDGTTSKENQYNDPLLHTIQSYVDYLDVLKATAGGNRQFNVNSIAILDAACQSALGGNGRKIAIRQNELATLTGGILGSLCADFGTTLASISNKIIELSTQFYLDRKPREGSLKVYVNGVQVPVSSQNGYVYNAINNSISFYGTAVPMAGAQITVSYDPTELR